MAQAAQPVKAGAAGLPSAWEAQCQALLSEEELTWINSVASAVRRVDSPAPALSSAAASARSAHETVLISEDELLWQQESRRLAAYCNVTSGLCCQMTDTQVVLADIDASYRIVSRKTSELAALCESLVREEQALNALGEVLAQRLPYFDQLESMASKLNHPHLQVDETYFVGHLRRVEECLEFLRAHPNIRDSEIYLTKYRQLQNRALLLLKDYVVGLLKETAAAISLDLGIEQGDSDAARARWRLLSARVQPLVSLVEQYRDQRDFASVLQDIYADYFGHRRALDTSAQFLASQHTESMIQDVQFGCTHLVARCESESELFRQLFGQTSSALRLLMEALAGPFYDTLRVRVVRSHSVHDLCGVVKVVSAEFLPRAVLHTPLEALKPLFRRIVQDAQVRLIFIAQAVVRDEITSSAPVPEFAQLLAADLERLRQPVAPFSKDSDELTLRERQCGLHPSLHKTVTLLGQLFSTLEIASFEGLAVEAVSACSHSLCLAASAMSKSVSKLDSHLFLARQLIILEQELVPFNVNLFIKERTLDFGHIKNLLMRVLTGEIALSSLLSLTSSSALYTFLQSAAPRLTQSEKDIKRDLHALLTQTMEAVLLCITQDVLQPVLNFMSRKSHSPGQDPAAVAVIFSSSSPALLASHIQLVKLYLAGLPVPSRTVVSNVSSAVRAAIESFNKIASPTIIDVSQISLE